MADDSFNLIDEPWIPVLTLDRETKTVGIRQLIHEASTLRAISAETPSVNFAITRIILAVIYASLRDNPTSDPFELWESWWEAKELDIDSIDVYLDTWKHRFDLWDDTAPFLQTPGLHTAKNETKDLSLIIADSPGAASLYSRTDPSEPLDYATAARWLVHANAFDYSGIKSGAVGDDRVKGGKGYPMGIGWCGWLGGTTVVGSTLAETLLLNTIATYTFADGDCPIWEEKPLTAAARPGAQARGQLSLFTWPQRRILLVRDNGKVTGCLVCNGDPVDYTVQLNNELMTPFRYSLPQTKKAKTDIYMPRAMMRGRSLWRGLETLLPRTNGEKVSSGVSRSAGDVNASLPAKNVEWVGELVENEILPDGFRIILDVVGVEYGAQSASWSVFLHDTLDMPSALANADNKELQDYVLAAVERSTEAMKQYLMLCGNLAVAAGGDSGPARDRAAREFTTGIDVPFRQWLATVGSDGKNPEEKLAEFTDYLLRSTIALGQHEARQAPPAAWKGRTDGDYVINVPVVYRRFEAGLRKKLSAHPTIDTQTPVHTFSDKEPS